MTEPMAETIKRWADAHPKYSPGWRAQRVLTDSLVAFVGGTRGTVEAWLDDRDTPSPIEQFLYLTALEALTRLEEAKDDDDEAS